MRDKKKSLLSTFSIILISIFILFSAIAVYMISLKDKLIEETKAYLSEVSKQKAISIYTIIENDLKQLQSIVAVLDKWDFKSKEDLIKSLNLEQYETETFPVLGIISLDGKCLTTDNVTINCAEKDYFKQALGGQVCVTDEYINKKQVTVYAVPIYKENKVKFVLTLFKSTEKILNQFLPTSFDGDGYSIICDNSGKILIHSLKNINNSKVESISQYKFQDSFKIADMQKNKNGITIFTDEFGNKNYMAYEYLTLSNWYSISIIPEKIIFKRYNSLMTIAGITWSIVAMVFIVNIVYILVNNHKHKKKLKKLAYLDDLTGYQNFYSFKNNATEKLIQESSNPHIIVEFDIKGFKVFNDSYGYSAGDIVIKLIAFYCNQMINKGEFFSRTSADHFVLLLNWNRSEMIKNRLEELNNNIKNDPIIISNNYKFEMFFGVYNVYSNETNINKVINKAIYAKKEISGRFDKNIEFYSEEMYLKTLQEKEIEDKMENALKEKEFEVFLQPKIEIETGKIIEAEALVRWNDPQKGVISPAVFIPIFEKDGFIELMDMYILENICKLLHKWQDRKLCPIKISVNASKIYIFKPNFPEQFKDILDKYKIDPKYIEIEITESVGYSQTDELILIIQKLKSLGFSIAMDDFGSGYSSLNMLKDIPIDVIKIDQEFFKNNTDIKRGNTVVHGIVTIAKKLGIKTVAEGVETKEQLDFLKSIECDIGQGYYFSKPMSIKEFEKLLFDNDVK